jgi:hypothetical protein
MRDRIEFPCGCVYSFFPARRLENYGPFLNGFFVPFLPVYGL